VNRCRRFAVAWLVSVGVGCASAPIRYYTLIQMPDKTMPVLGPPFAIEVRVLHFPPHLNRPELMVRTGSSEMTLLENERWASPLNDEIKQALRLELEHQLDQMSGLRPAFTKLTLDIDLKQLEAQLGRYALLRASWSATLSTSGAPSAKARAMTCAFEADDKITAGYAGIVEGYQREIAALADAILSVLTSAANSIDAPCR
jgi:uncharacterized protein